MFLNDRKSADRLRTQRMLFSAWMALAALVVIITMAAGLVTSAHAEEAVDYIHTSSIASAPISKASDRIFVIVLVRDRLRDHGNRWCRSDDEQHPGILVASSPRLIKRPRPFACLAAPLLCW